MLHGAAVRQGDFSLLMMSTLECNMLSVSESLDCDFRNCATSAAHEPAHRCSEIPAHVEESHSGSHHISTGLKLGIDRRSSCEEGPACGTRSAHVRNCRRSSTGVVSQIHRCISSPGVQNFSATFQDSAGRNVDEGKIERGKADLESMGFDSASYTDEELAELVLEIFLLLRLNEHLNIPHFKLKLFIARVRQHMFANPYHNWTHVADVVQASYALGLSTGLLHRLAPLQQFALLVSALCHDLEHPGVNNLTLLQSQPEVSALYADSSTLEKHHSLRAFSLMLHHEVDLLSGLDIATYYDFREMVTRIIMATDMNRHREYCCRAERLPEDLLLEIEILIKCADTANVLRPMRIAKRWAVKIGTEFFAQGDLERSMGLHVTPTCDRKSQTVVGLQKGFIDFCIGPFFDSVAKLYPSAAPALQQVWKNREEWEGYDDAALIAEVSASLAL